MIRYGGGEHAANISARILKHYDDLFQQKYPFPKMQSVAIPDFDAGAMENYGLNTYR
jgi:aminopeptidase N